MPQEKETPLSRRFTTDVLLSVVQFLPYPSLGSLKTTCKWMYRNITKEQEEKARAKGKENFGKVDVVKGNWEMKHMYRIRSLKEEVIDIGRFQATSKIIMAKFAGINFIGTVVESGDASTERLFNALLTFNKKRTSEPIHNVVHFEIKSKHPFLLLHNEKLTICIKTRCHYWPRMYFYDIELHRCVC